MKRDFSFNIGICQKCGDKMGVIITKLDDGFHFLIHCCFSMGFIVRVVNENVSVEYMSSIRKSTELKD